MSPEQRRQAMEARAKGAEDYWRNYLTFKGDATSDRDTALQRIEQQERFGSLAPAQAAAAREAVERDYQTQLGAIEQGPTRQLLEQEFEAQRTEARTMHDVEQSRLRKHHKTDYDVTYALERDGRPYGSQTVRTSYVEGGRGEPGTYLNVPRNAIVQEAVAVNPFQEAEFEFASSAEEFFGGMFGTEASPGEGEKFKPPGAKLRPGDATGSAIGVGQVYSWY